LKNFVEYITGSNNQMSIESSKDRNSLVFAFVGDAVFSLFVRTFLADISTAKAGVLHIEASKFVRASYQKKLIEMLDDVLTENEQAIALTSRNAKTNNVAKNSNLEEYKKSTSFEAVLGYLYLTGQNDRLLEILDICQRQIKSDLND